MQEEALNIVIGTITHLEKTEGSDRLFKVSVNAGNKQYQIATSLAAYFQPEDLIGQQVPIKVDVKPTTIRGVLSDARFIAVMNQDREPVLLIPQQPVDNGCSVL